MTKNINWLKEQRVPGGYSFASAMILTNCEATKYVEFFISRINREHNLQLELKENLQEFEIIQQDQIVWFGRDIDVDLLRTIKVGLFEEIILGRIKTLRSIK